MAPDSRPAPRYGLISVAAPFVGVVSSFGFLLLTVGFRELNQWPDLTVRANRLGMLAMVILVGSCLAGLASAIAAFLRSERSWGLAVLGLILNAPPPALVIRAGLEQLVDWWQFG